MHKLLMSIFLISILVSALVITNAKESMDTGIKKPFLAEKSVKEIEDTISKMSIRPMLLLAKANNIPVIRGKNINLNNKPDFSNINSILMVDVPVGADPNAHENEPSIAAKPNRANILVAASHSLPDPVCKAFRSNNGGSSWSSVNLPLLNPTDFCSDPVVRWAPDGSKVYAIYMSIRSDFSTDDIVVSKSFDNGATWSRVIVAIPGYPNIIFPDKPWGDVHTSFNSGFSNNKLYVTSTRFTTVGEDIAFASSTNGANSFSPVKILASSSGLFAPVLQGSRPIGGKPTNKTNGDILVCWYNSDRDGFIYGSFSIKCKSSSNYGKNFGSEITAMDTSTFSNFEIPYYLGPNSQFHRWWGGMFPSLTITADGNAHMVFAAAPVDNNIDTNTGENGDIYYIQKSPPYDIGSWATPFRLNNDSSDRAQGYGTITGKQTSSSGPILVASWEDHRNSPFDPIPGIECGFNGTGNDSGVNCIYDIFYTKSSTGWGTSNEKLNTIPSVSDYSFIGDYIDSTSNNVLSDARSHVIWTDRRTKTSIFDFEDNTFTDSVIIP